MTLVGFFFSFSYPVKTNLSAPKDTTESDNAVVALAADDFPDDTLINDEPADQEKKSKAKSSFFLHAEFIEKINCFSFSIFICVTKKKQELSPRFLEWCNGVAAEHGSVPEFLTKWMRSHRVLCRVDDDFGSISWWIEQFDANFEEITDMCDKEADFFKLQFCMQIAQAFFVTPSKLDFFCFVFEIQFGKKTGLAPNISRSGHANVQSGRPNRPRHWRGVVRSGPGPVRVYIYMYFWGYFGII